MGGLQRRRDREPRSAPASWRDGPGRLDRDLRRLAADLEEGLRTIDFPEVTIEDRITFLEQAVAWQVRRALWNGRFDLAVRLQRVGAERIAEIHERRHGWRPVLLYGVPTPRFRRIRSGPGGASP